MRTACATREQFMNGSRTILPRVGGGVGEGVGDRENPYFPSITYLGDPAGSWMALRAIGGGR